jgi:hypothetical protein
MSLGLFSVGNGKLIEIGVWWGRMELWQSCIILDDSLLLMRPILAKEHQKGRKTHSYPHRIPRFGRNF